MIWHVVKKDLRTLWWLGPVLVLSAFAYAHSFSYRVDRFGEFDFLLPYLVIGGPYLAVAIALGWVVQVDSPATPRADWHTRPVSRWSLIGGKVFVALAGVILPWTLIDFGWSLAWKIGPGEALAGAVLHELVVAAGLMLVMTMAAATRSLGHFLLGLIGIALASLAASVLFPYSLAQRLGLIFLNPRYFSPGLFASALTLMAGLLLCALILLCHRRRVGAAWAAILCATLGLTVTCVFVSSFLSTHWPAIIRAEPDEAKGVSVELAATPLQVRGSGFTVLSAPLKIAKPDNVTLEVDRGLITQRWADGEVMTDMIRWQRFGANLLADKIFTVQRRSSEAPSPERLEMKVRLRVRKVMPKFSLADETTVAMPGGGACRITTDPRFDARSYRRLACVSGKPICIEIKRADGVGYIGDGGGGQCFSTQPKTGRYVYTTGLNSRALPLTISRHLEVGLVDRSIHTGPFTPEIIYRDRLVPAPPSPPVNGK